VAELIRQNALAWRELLHRPEPPVDRRPDDDRWSTLEYACHVRDVYRLYDVRLHLMLDQDDPQFPNWDQDVTAVEDRYNEQDPARVVHDLEEAAATIAESFEDVAGDAWQRPGTRSDGARFTVETFARYLVHDPIHHVYDAEENIARLSGAPAEHELRGDN
jgi:hypothetical protein